MRKLTFLAVMAAAIVLSSPALVGNPEGRLQVKVLATGRLMDGEIAERLVNLAALEGVDWLGAAGEIDNARAADMQDECRAELDEGYIQFRDAYQREDADRLAMMVAMPSPARGCGSAMPPVLRQTALAAKCNIRASRQVPLRIAALSGAASLRFPAVPMSLATLRLALRCQQQMRFAPRCQLQFGAVRSLLQPALFIVCQCQFNLRHPASSRDYIG